MNELFTPSAKEALHLAQRLAKKLRHHEVGTEHLLYGLVSEGSGVAAKTITDQAVSAVDIHDEIEALTGYGPDDQSARKVRYLPYSPRASQVLEQATNQAQLLEAPQVGTSHILLALLRDQTILADRILVNLGLSIVKTRKLLLQKMGINPKNKTANSTHGGKKRESTTPTLDSLARDLTAMARQKLIDPVIGRDVEITRAIQILCRRTKNNPVFIG